MCFGLFDTTKQDNMSVDDHCNLKIAHVQVCLDLFENKKQDYMYKYLWPLHIISCASTGLIQPFWHEEAGLFIYLSADDHYMLKVTHAQVCFDLFDTKKQDYVHVLVHWWPLHDISCSCSGVLWPVWHKEARLPVSWWPRWDYEGHGLQTQQGGAAGEETQFLLS